MARYQRFTILCDSTERQLISNLALRLKRTRSDAVRFILLSAYERLDVYNESPIDCSQNQENLVEKEVA